MIDEDKLNALELFGENEYLHKEIERLNKELKQEKKDFKEANDKCFKLISENKRLNNIINELENYIRARADDNDTCSVCSVMTDELLNILKGSE